MGRILKRVAICLICTLVYTSIMPHRAMAGAYINTYYSNDTKREISKGVEHISGKKLTNRGIIDLEIIKVDLSNKDLKFENVFDRDVMGKKTTVSNLVKGKNGLVAAVNGDFFEMGLSPSFELGVTINDGRVEKMSSGEYYNCYSDSLASMVFDINNNPNIEFIKTNVVFSNDKDTLYASYYNKAGDKIGTTILTGEYFTTTASADSRNANTYKIVVENDEIVDIIAPGISVNISSDQYVVLLPESFNRIENFQIGDRVKLDISYTAKDANVTIGGAGVFLKNGVIVSNGYIINSYTARTFVGYDAGAKNLYFGTVGGLTSTNAGVNNNQLGELLAGYGITDAMHLDGGGSTTLVAKNECNSNVKQINDVKSQRAVINAFALVNESKSGKVVGIKLNVSSNKAILNAAMPYEVIAYDENHLPCSVDLGDLEITSDNDIVVDYKRKTIKFNDLGRTILNVKCGGFEDSIYVDVYNSLTEIQILPDPIVIEMGEEKEVQIIALTGEKHKMALDPNACSYVISPSSLARVEDGMIIGLSSGVGTITVNYDGLSASSILSVGTSTKQVDNFNSSKFTSVSYPDYVKTNVKTSLSKLVIDYDFEKSEDTQASYAKYEKNMELPKGATKLIADVCGDGNDTQLKVKLVDDSKNAYNVTLVDKLDSTSYKTYEVELPQEYSGKLYIERYYVVSIGTSKDIASSISISNVRCLASQNYSGVSVPKSITRGVTSNNSSMTKVLDNDYVFINNYSSGNMLSNYVDDVVSKKLATVNDEKLILARSTAKNNGIIAANGLNKYQLDDLDATLIAMSTINGSAFDKDPYQYGQLENILKQTNTKNVIITLDGDLLSQDRAKDKAMLEYILLKNYEERRVNYYVVMLSGSAPCDKSDNGIRYIRLTSDLKNAYGKNVLLIRKSNGQNDGIDYNVSCYAELLNN